MTAPDLSILDGLSGSARKVINAGDDHEWYAKSERIADEIVAAGIARQPFTYDRLVLVPNHIGIALRTALLETEKCR